VAGTADGTGHHALAAIVNELDRATLGVEHPQDHAWLRMSGRRGFVYRGSAFPAFRGTYVLGDYVTGRMWPLRGATLGAPSGLAGVSGFGIDDRHELYAVSLGGALYRIGFRKV